MASKTWKFSKPVVKIETSTGTTYTSKPTTVTGGSGPRQQIYIGAEKIVERTGEGGTVRVPVRTNEGVKWVVESKAEENIQSLQRSGLSRAQAEDKVLAGNVIRDPGIKLREQEYLVKEVNEKGPVGEFLPRKQLRSDAAIAGQLRTLAEQQLAEKKEEAQVRSVYGIKAVGENRLSEKAYRALAPTLEEYGRGEVSSQEYKLPSKIIRIKPEKRLEGLSESITIKEYPPIEVERPAPKRANYGEGDVFSLNIPASEGNLTAMQEEIPGKYLEDTSLREFSDKQNWEGYYLPGGIISLGRFGKNIKTYTHELAHSEIYKQNRDASYLEHGLEFQNKLTEIRKDVWAKNAKTRIDLFSPKAKEAFGLKQGGNTLIIGESQRYKVESSFQLPKIALKEKTTEQNIPLITELVSLSKSELLNINSNKPIEQTVSGIGNQMDLSFLAQRDVTSTPEYEGFFGRAYDLLQQKKFTAYRQSLKKENPLRLQGSISDAGIGLQSLDGPIGFKTSKFKNAEIQIRGAALNQFGLYAGTSFLLSAQGTKELFTTNPITTAKNLGSSIKVIAGKIVTGEGFPMVGQVLREEPVGALGFLTAEITQAYAGGAIVSAGSSRLKQTIARLSPDYKIVKVEALAQKIKNVAIKGDKVDIGLIPAKSGLQINPADVDDLLRGTRIPLSTQPKIPKLTSQQKIIIDIAKEQGDLLSGSFGQKVLLESKYTRPFADIDIAAKNPLITSNIIKERIGNIVDVTKKTITDSPLGQFDIFRVTSKQTGKVIADIDPIKFVEEGMVKNFPDFTVDGYKLVSPEARLAAKVKQYARGKDLGGKVSSDINMLSTGTIDFDKPLLRGAFGYTQSEQQAFLGKTGTLATSARDFFKYFKGDDVVVGSQGLYATPFDIKTGQPMTRISRLGLEQRRATFADILRGDFTLRSEKPQILLFPKQRIGDVFDITPGTELEVFAQPGLLVKKTRRAGTTIINKRVIPIYEVGIGRPSKELDALSKVAGKVKQVGIPISNQDRTRLSKLLSAESGFDVSGSVISEPLLPFENLGFDTFRISTKAVKPRSMIRSAPSYNMGFDTREINLAKRFSLFPIYGLSRTISYPAYDTINYNLPVSNTGDIFSKTSDVLSKVSYSIPGKNSGILLAPSTSVLDLPGKLSVPFKPSTLKVPFKTRLIPKPTKKPKPILPKLPRLYWQDTRKKSKTPSGRPYAYTPDFISAVQNAFGKQPKQGIFTGQERRPVISSDTFEQPLINGGYWNIFRKKKTRRGRK